VPEGDTIFRAARTLHRALAGKVVTRFETVVPALARVHDDAPITGRTVDHVAAAGKHLLMAFSGPLTLRTHMRMNGSWHIYRPGERWQRPTRAMRIVVGVADFVAVGFDVPVAEFLTERQRARQPTLRALGPDLLGGDFDEEEAVRRLRARSALTIADALLDQRAVAGAGNVYKSETLFACRVSPLARVADLDDETLRALVRAARRLTAHNVTDSARGGIVTYTGLRRTTRRADPAERLWVYGRRGKPCRTCGTPITALKHGPHTRTTNWCPRCQQRPEKAASVMEDYLPLRPPIPVHDFLADRLRESPHQRGEIDIVQTQGRQTEAADAEATEICLPCAECTEPCASLIADHEITGHTRLPGAEPGKAAQYAVAPVQAINRSR
jgi:endonuclease-8